MALAAVMMVRMRAMLMPHLVVSSGLALLLALLIFFLALDRTEMNQVMVMVAMVTLLSHLARRSW